MITVEDIIKFSKPHPWMLGGKQTTLVNKDIVLSIVGGQSNLYGDFVETFEIAVIDKKTNEFITQHFFPQSYNDVLSLSKKDLEEALNLYFKNFQVL